MFKYTGPIVTIRGLQFGIASRVSQSVKLFSQETGRWSQTGPPMAQLPVRMRKLIGIDPGWPQFGYDVSNAEMRIAAILAGDKPLLDAFEYGWDTHTLNACELFDMEYPPNRSKNAIMTGTECAAWREEYDWAGEEDARRKFGKIFGFRCMPMDTQILTRGGWKYFDTVQIGEEVLTYNAELGIKEWSPLLDKVYYPTAPVIQMEHNHFFKVRSTPDHRWFVRKRSWLARRNGWETRPYMREVVQTTNEINTESNIIVNAPMSFDNGLGYAEWPIDKFSTDYTQAVCKMSSEQRKAFLQGFLLGEGYVRKTKNTTAWNWSQNRTNIFDALLTASFIESSGFCYITYENREGNPNTHCSVNMALKGHVTGQKLIKTYVGMEAVWCPVTVNGSWVMRQGDVISITGNSLYGGTPEGAYKIPGANKLGRNKKQLTEAGYKWLSAHPGVSQFCEEVGNEAMRRRIVRNPYGRRRVLTSSDEQARRREGINHPIQSFVADFINEVVPSTWNACNALVYGAEIVLDERSIVRLIAQCHDSLLFAFPAIYFEECQKIARDVVERPRTFGSKIFQFPVSSYTKGK